MPVNPADSPILGTLYGSDAMRAVFDERAYFQRMLDVEAALARVQAQLGIIPADAAAAITRAARVDNLVTEELAASARNVGYPVVGLVAGLSRAAGEAGRWTHWGATTQDIMDTATVLQIRDGLALIRTALRGMVTALSAQADKHRRTVMAGRTHLQQALPITLGLKCAVWAQPLIAHIHRLDALRPRVQQVSFAGAAGTLASLGDQGIAVMEGLATELDLAAPAAPWHVSRDGFAETVAFLGLICGSLAKLATDVILLAQTEVGELAEPYVAGRGSSSTMPQKRNPIASEYILAAARTVHALVPVMLGAMAADHERATGPWQAELLALPQAFVLTHGALQHAGAIAEGMVIDAPRMRRNLDLTGGLIVAEAVMMGLAPHIGRGEAHHVVKHACDAALAETIPLADALAREPAIAGHLDRAAIDRLTDPAHYLGSSDGFIDRVLRAARALD
ncbi:MAG TPA: adenylosuccinate lyase family protein [Acetobacteraceae bacterium]|nr:adenylosuccinate lyase family protein [Acetobacteraceae bacterium]